MIKIFLESDKFSHKAGVTKHATNTLARKSNILGAPSVPVAPYRCLLPNMHWSVADIANPDLLACGCRTWISLDIENHIIDTPTTRTQHTNNTHPTYQQHTPNIPTTRTQHTNNTYPTYQQHAPNIPSTRIQHTNNTHPTHQQHIPNTPTTRTQHTINTYPTHQQHVPNTPTTRTHKLLTWYWFRFKFTKEQS